MLVASGKMSLEQVGRDEFTQVYTAFAAHAVHPPSKVHCNMFAPSFLDL